MALAREKVLVPVMRVPDGEDANGKAKTKEVPDLMGHRMRRMRMTVNYHDCCKVIVEGEARAVAALKAESLAYWARLWGTPREEAELADLDDPDDTDNG